MCEIDTHIDKNKKQFEEATKENGQSKIFNTMETIINNYGVRRLNPEYESISDKDLIEKYDQCFLLMLHTIRSKEIKELLKSEKLNEKIGSEN